MPYSGSVRARVILACFTCFLALAAVDAQTPSASPPPPPARVLFIGNSLTIANDLPATVAALAKAAGRTVTTETVAFNNFSLEDHWQQGESRRRIARGGWSFVVLQQGPSALPESQVLLREFTKRFDEDIRKAGAKTALFQVWPSKTRFGDFDGVSRSYTNAASDVSGVLLPAGDAWRAAWKREPALALYGPDEFHPSAAGSYLAALVMVRRLFDVSPVGLPAPGIPAPTAKLLQEVAASISTSVPAPPRGMHSPR
jgi:hypothetical protein